MSTTYTWSITGLTGTDPDADNDLDLITSATWLLSGTDGTNTATLSGATPLNISMDDTVDPEGLFHTLLESTIIADVQTALGLNQIDSYKANIEQNLAARLLPPVVSPPLPWVV